MDALSNQWYLLFQSSKQNLIYWTAGQARDQKIKSNYLHMTDKTTETLSLCSRAGWTASQAYVAESSRLVGRNLMVLVTVFRPAEVPSSSASSRESKKKNLVKIRVEKNRPLENLTWNISVYDLSPKLKWCSEIIFVRDVEQKIDWIILHYEIFFTTYIMWEISYYVHIDTLLILLKVFFIRQYGAKDHFRYHVSLKSNFRQIFYK